MVTAPGAEDAPPSEPVDERVKSLVQLLAGNDLRTRNAGVKKLKRILAKSASGDNREFFIAVWKGLHYNMWMQDKPLLQEDLAERMSALILDIPDTENTLAFISAFFETESREWFGLDQWRVNKFMMLSRTFLGNVFAWLAANDFDPELSQQVTSLAIEKVFMNTDCSFGYQRHIVDLWLQELSPYYDDMSKNMLFTNLKPFVDFASSGKRSHIVSYLCRGLFDELICQTIDALQSASEPKSEDAEEEEGEEDASPPPIDLKELGDYCFKVGKDPETGKKARSVLYFYSKRLKDAARGKFMEDEGDPDLKKSQRLTSRDKKAAVERLLQMEEGGGFDAEIAEEMKKRKKRRRREANAQERRDGEISEKKSKKDQDSTSYTFGVEEMTEADLPAHIREKLATTKVGKKAKSPEMASKAGKDKNKKRAKSPTTSKADSPTAKKQKPSEQPATKSVKNDITLPQAGDIPSTMSAFAVNQILQPSVSGETESVQLLKQQKKAKKPESSVPSPIDFATSLKKQRPKKVKSPRYFDPEQPEDNSRLVRDTVTAKTKKKARREKGFVQLEEPQSGPAVPAEPLAREAHLPTFMQHSVQKVRKKRPQEVADFISAPPAEAEDSGSAKPAASPAIKTPPPPVLTTPISLKRRVSFKPKLEAPATPGTGDGSVYLTPTRSCLKVKRMKSPRR